jgi:hypothetical protein
MMKLGRFKFVVGSALSGALLAGCNGLASSPSVFSPPTSLSSTRPEKSWIRPDAIKGDIVYVNSPYSDSIYLFSYPELNLVGLIVNPSKWKLVLGGLCSDVQGNVFVPLLSQNEILEFAHGKTKPFATIATPGAQPYSCTYDPKTGDLAVIEHLVSGVLAAAIYSHESGEPTVYQDGYVQEVAWASYDGSGNLFVDGGLASYQLSELPRGAKAFKNITVKQFVDGAGTLQWDGKHLTTFTDLSTGGCALDKLKISGSTAAVVGTIPINNVGGTWAAMAGRHVIIGNQAGNALQVFDYPSGGNFTKSTDVYQASAVTLSVGTKR